MYQKHESALLLAQRIAAYLVIQRKLCIERSQVRQHRDTADHGGDSCVASIGASSSTVHGGQSYDQLQA